MMNAELDEPIYADISGLCKDGDSNAEIREFEKAVASYVAAWNLLPEPKDQWTAATWIQTAIGDAYFLSGDYENAFQAFVVAVHCPDGLGNPFIHLRIGECAFERGEMPRAKDELARAYMGGGTEIFSTEDPKYFALVKTTLIPPLPGEH